MYTIEGKRAAGEKELRKFKRVDLKKNKPPEVEVDSLKRPIRRLLEPDRQRISAFRAAVRFTGGGRLALFAPGRETYRPTPDDPQFWFHLAVEGTIALYAAFFYLVIWKIWQRLK